MYCGFVLFLFFFFVCLFFQYIVLYCPHNYYVNPNSFLLSDSHFKLTHQNREVQTRIEPVPLVPQFLAHPYQDTTVTLPWQWFHTLYSPWVNEVFELRLISFSSILWDSVLLRLCLQKNKQTNKERVLHHYHTCTCKWKFGRNKVQQG